MKHIFPLALLALAALTASPALLAEAPPSTQAYMEANERMHRDMNIAFSGDVDVDFVRGMIPHHQGAIDMARVVLEYSEDPELRQLASAIVVAQEAEIAQMEAWLTERGHPLTAPDNHSDGHHGGHQGHHH